MIHIVMRDYLFLFTVSFVGLILLPSCVNSPPKLQQMKGFEVSKSRAVFADSGRGAKYPRLIGAQVLNRVNKYRTSKGLNSLTNSTLLNNLASKHSEYMRRDAKLKGRLTHISHDGADSRFEEITKTGDYVATSENVGMVMGVAEKYVSVSLVEGWIDSKPHHKAIKGDWRETGVGVAIGENNTVYATQLFAR